MKKLPNFRNPNYHFFFWKIGSPFDHQKSRDAKQHVEILGIDDGLFDVEPVTNDVGFPMVELITALENMVSAVENLETDAEVITTTVAPIEDKESQTKKDDSDESTERSDSDEDDVDDGLETDSDEVSIDIPDFFLFNNEISYSN